ncbi:MAG: DUF3127 domain-containing protein [Candidatus Azobacteroides sp.]|nr:DUF3127 domain-containing protein [Candidatus Azobacteroides sp.]
MQLTARLFQVLPLQSGISRNGEWKKQDIVVETDGQFPKKICVSIWGDKINQAQLQQGNMLTIDFDVESREYNGRWYTDVKAWKIELAGENSANPVPASMPAEAGFPPPPPLPENENDDLPF